MKIIKNIERRLEKLKIPKEIIDAIIKPLLSEKTCG